MREIQGEGEIQKESGREGGIQIEREKDGGGRDRGRETAVVATDGPMRFYTKQRGVYHPSPGSCAGNGCGRPGRVSRFLSHTAV